MAQTPYSLVFSVRRCQPELVTPAKPTPHELKSLSDIDDQDGLRFQIPIIQFYGYDPSMAGKDPAKVIRDALAKALVFYYPFAGRLREGPHRKLTVDCNAKGVLFIEADADVRLDQFGDALQPPFPCFHELLYNVPCSEGIINCPLLLIQVTRLRCGGFIFALRLNHTMSDAIGLSQFLNAVAELARGANEPSITPVWSRELLNARYPPRITYTHREYEEVPHTNGTIISSNDLKERCFFFGTTEIAALRRFVPHHLGYYTSFEIIAACLWHCRTIALQMDPNEEVCIMFDVNVRAKFKPPIPVGYYGNAIGSTTAVTTAGKLCGNPLSYALELVKKAKNEVTEEYIHSVADLMVIRGRPKFRLDGSFILSDSRYVGFRDVNYGWGEAVYGGVAFGVGDFIPEESVCISVKNIANGEGVIIPISLPAEAMDRFAKELDQMISAKPIFGGQYSTSIIKSLL